MFVDTAKIRIIAGTGGSGAVAFHREKYVAAGGPDGGDGGRGGNVVFKADSNMSTLMDFRYKKKYQAQDGAPGGSKKCSGKNGEDLTVRVPVGTVIRDAKSGAVIKDLSDSEPFILAHGGRGGWGNQHFATPTRQCPRFAKAGLPGEDIEITLELKLLADVGLVGFPNVGKSTLLSVVSAARPKIADYHFTTLTPNLGFVVVGDTSFVMADIPGIIEGASDGAGLGYDFLRHIDRCRLLVHVVDVSGSEARDPVSDFELINEELRAYSPELATRPQVVAANKIDALEPGSDTVAKLREHVGAKGFDIFEISAAAHIGVKELIDNVAVKLAGLPPVVVYESEYIPPAPDLGSSDDVSIIRQDRTWILEGKWLARIIGNVNFDDYESRMYFDRMLRKSGLMRRLETMGLEEGDTVSIYNLEFDYVK